MKALIHKDANSMGGFAHRVDRPSAAEGLAHMTHGLAARAAIFLALIFVWCGTAAAQSGTAGFGNQWVRSHPFTTYGWPFGSAWAIPTYQGENFSNYFSNSMTADYYKLPWIAISDLSESLSTIETRLQQQYISINYIDDEPSTHHFDDVAYNAQQTRIKRPDLPVLVNGLADGYDYAHDMVSAIHPDIVSFDKYPWKNGSSDWGSFFNSLNDYRTVALAANIPLFDWIQAYGKSSGPSMPSESQMRANVYASLAFGVKGIGYYSFGMDSNSNRSLLNADGTPSAYYPYAADINAQVAKVGQSLRYLTSTGVGFLYGGSGSVAPSGLSGWTQGTGGDPHLIDAGSDNGNANQSGLLGFFTDDAGQHYFMLVNLYQDTNLTSPQSNSTFQLAFDSSIGSLLELNPTTGLTDVIPLNNHVLTITLPGGQGYLFKYNDGPFAGVPEPGTGAMMLLVGGLVLMKRRKEKQ
jgi:hypothetical protein